MKSNLRLSCGTLGFKMWSQSTQEEAQRQDLKSAINEAQDVQSQNVALFFPAVYFPFSNKTFLREN